MKKKFIESILIGITFFALFTILIVVARGCQTDHEEYIPSINVRG